VAYTLEELSGRDKKHLVQLAKPIEKLKGYLKFPVYVSEKYDGVYCIAYYDGNDVTIYSRTGEVYTSMKHIEEHLKLMMLQHNFVIFEAYCPGVVQATISGWCRDTKGQHMKLRAYLHDYLTIGEFRGEEDTPYSERLLALRGQWYDYAMDAGTPCNLLLVKQIQMYDKKSIFDLAKEKWANGKEGLVVRQDTPYEGGKRNFNILKVKQGVSYDLKVISLEEGKGKYKGMVGKLVCRWKDDKVIKVGSGLSDAQRKLWWSEFNYDEILGKIVQIDAMTLSSKGVLRDPRFKGIRYDKTKGVF